MADAIRFFSNLLRVRRVSGPLRLSGRRCGFGAGVDVPQTYRTQGIPLHAPYTPHTHRLRPPTPRLHPPTHRLHTAYTRLHPPTSSTSTPAVARTRLTVRSGDADG